MEAALHDSDLKAAGDDRAMSLELAIFKFVCVSNKIHPTHFIPVE